MLRAGLGESGGMQKVERPKAKAEFNLGPESFSMNGEGHTLSVEEGKVYMASRKGLLTSKLSAAIAKVPTWSMAISEDSERQTAISEIKNFLSEAERIERQLINTSASVDAALNRQLQLELEDLADKVGAFGNKYGLTELLRNPSLKYPTVQKCSNEYLELINDEKDKLKKNVHPPAPQEALAKIKKKKKLKGKSACVTLPHVVSRKSALQALHDMRVREQAECFTSIDATHQQQIDESQEGINRCDEFITLFNGMNETERIATFPKYTGKGNWSA